MLGGGGGGGGGGGEGEGVRFLRDPRFDFVVVAVAASVVVVVVVVVGIGEGGGRHRVRTLKKPCCGFSIADAALSPPTASTIISSGAVWHLQGDGLWLLLQKRGWESRQRALLKGLHSEEHTQPLLLKLPVKVLVYRAQGFN